MAVGDLNSDGKSDIVVTNYWTNSVVVLMNTTAPGASTPSFAAPVTFALGPPAEPQFLAEHIPYGEGNWNLDGPVQVFLRDLSGDGKLDIVANEQIQTNGAPSGAIAILMNTTAPGATVPAFAAPQTIDPGPGYYSLAVGDVTGDGLPDLVVTSELSVYGPSTVSVLVNTTAPGASTVSFATPVNFDLGGSANQVALGDLTGDGKLDIVVAGSQDNSTSGEVFVLLNTTAPGAAAPSFAAPSVFAVGYQPSGLVLGDLTGDGKLDIVVTDSTVSHGSMVEDATVLTNTTALDSGELSFDINNFPIDGSAWAVTLGDVNGDGKLDIVVTLAEDYSENVEVLVNTTAPGATTASFAAPVRVGLYEPIAVALADLTGDGSLDISPVSAIRARRFGHSSAFR